MIFVIRTEVSPEIGNGHLMRCLTLCSKFRKRGAHIHLISKRLPIYIKEFLNFKGIKYHLINLESCIGSKEDALKTRILLQRIKNVDLLVVDSYEISEKWEKEMRLFTKKILVIDDLANRRHECDFLIDQNLRNNQERYNNLVPNQAKIYLGPKYAFLREEFYKPNLPRLRRGKIKKVLVFFGSGDNTQEILKVLKVIDEITELNIQWNLLIGKNISINKYNFKKNINPNLNIIEYTDKISKLILEADLGIGTCGVAAWERCFLGLPSIVVVTAENQLQDAEILDDKGAIINLGNSQDVSAEKLLSSINKLIMNGYLIERMSKNSLAILNGHIQAMNNIENDILKSLQNI
tara:strand:- start:650 stop:1699 length:1050 start_codon:yes stop_codon:yes gene_type:complete